VPGDVAEDAESGGDRETIERLIRVLDTDEGLAMRPPIVPVRYAEATDVAEVIRDVFRSQLTRASYGADGPRASAASRMRPEVAVDPATNSLVVMAPAPLLDEILQLITRLDEAAEQNPARNLKIIPLQKASASRIEAALQRILHSRPTRAAR
jgi:type II secretory pathway component GspD/PulD (secretin)